MYLQAARFVVSIFSVPGMEEAPPSNTQKSAYESKQQLSCLQLNFVVMHLLPFFFCSIRVFALNGQCLSIQMLSLIEMSHVHSQQSAYSTLFTTL